MYLQHRKCLNLLRSSTFLVALENFSLVFYSLQFIFLRLYCFLNSLILFYLKLSSLFILFIYFLYTLLHIHTRSFLCIYIISRPAYACIIYILQTIFWAISSFLCGVTYYMIFEIFQLLYMIQSIKSSYLYRLLVLLSVDKYILYVLRYIFTVYYNVTYSYCSI